MMQKIQKFGGAMFTPVLLFSFAGVMVGIGTLCTTEAVLGSLAAPTSMWYLVWNVILQGAWCVFNQLPLLFVIIWPNIQHGMQLFQNFVMTKGALGVWVFILLERLLIPFGLHHLLYSPFYYDNLVCPGGIYAYWATHFETPIHWQYESTTSYFILIDILFFKYLDYRQRKETEHELG